MPPLPQRTGPPSIGLPHLDRWMWNVLGGLLALFAVELVLRAAGLDVDALAWRPAGAGFGPWQPVTRFAVQGFDVLGVLFSLLAVYFLLPDVGHGLGRRTLGEAIAAAAIGAIVVPGVADALRAAGLVRSGWIPLHGWWPLTVALVVLFGLLRPNTVVTVFVLFFPLPVPTAVFVWGPLVVPGLLLLAGIATGGDLGGPLQMLGVWAGTFGWWHLRGPAGRRRRLQRKGRKIERELTRLQVLPGGRSGNRYDVH